EFALSQNHPNPFNPETMIHFDLPTPGETELSLFNLMGQRVATLVSGSRDAGSYMLRWDGRDDTGRELASGVYLFRLIAGDQIETRKLTLLR
ncbi:MAG: T9SS type A sorting domain-containing protein, partial [Gemmatimonadetes bacterium]|nr:T9SS type A sorting domain-containing protein [Gemmatimonadota bacterium]